jgi:signal transduction histidine kinase/ligand-binding sensor domain-containing protein
MGQYNYMSFQQLTQKDGLSQNTVNAFLQDREGFMWIATQDGLNRYDGYRFKVFRQIPGDSTSLCDNFVLQLVEDVEGRIWIGTRNGLAVYDKRKGHFQRIYLDDKERQQFHSKIRSITLDHNNNVVVSSAAANLFTLRLNNSGVCTKEPHPLKRGVLYYDAARNTYAHWNATEVRFLNHRLQKLQTLQLSGQVNESPLVAFASGFTAFSNGKYCVLLRKQSSIADTILASSKGFIRSIHVANDTTLLIGTDVGLRIFDITKNITSQQISKVDRDRNGLASDQINALYTDRNGLWWIGTIGGGINFSIGPNAGFQSVTAFRNQRLKNGPVWAFKQVDGFLLAGTSNGLCTPFNDTKPKWWNNTLDTIFITSLEVVRDQLWVGTRYNYVLTVDLNTGQLRTVSEQMKSKSIHHIYNDNDECVWVSTWVGLYHYSPEGTLIRKYLMNDSSELKFGYVTHALRTTTGNLYVCGSGGLAMLDETKQKFISYQHEHGNINSPAYNITNSISEDPEGNIWCATMGGGVSIMNVTTKTFTHLNMSNGLVNNSVYGCLFTSDDMVWMSTNEGIVAYSPKSETFKTFHSGHGLASEEFAVNAFYQDETLRCYFGAAEGFVMFHHDHIATSVPGSTPYITGFRVNYKELNYISGEPLRLLPAERNIDFEFAAPEFINADQIIYNYRLIAFDSIWRETPVGQRVATFTNLPYGEVTFELRYKIKGYDWNESILRIPIYHEIPFYLTWWFLLLIAVVIISILAIIIRYFSQHKLRRQLRELEVRQRLQDERERIARDLHDNVGAQITYMISSLDNISFKLEQHQVPAPAIEKVENLSEFARTTMEQLRSSIWAMNSEQIKLSEFVQRIQTHAQRMAENSEQIDIKVEHSPLDDYDLAPRIAMELSRVAQEAVTNSFKHSRANEIKIQVESKFPDITITIRDNGTGFDTTTNKKGHYGLENMKIRMEKIGAEFKIESEINKGTTVFISWKEYGK